MAHPVYHYHYWYPKILSVLDLLFSIIQDFFLRCTRVTVECPDHLEMMETTDPTDQLVTQDEQEKPDHPDQKDFQDELVEMDLEVNEEQPEPQEHQDREVDKEKLAQL